MKPLARDEWNFEECPREELSYCWAYEYARSAEWIRRDYLRAAPTEQICMRVTDEFSILLPLGFPQKPYLKTKGVTRPQMPRSKKAVSVMTGTKGQVIENGDFDFLGCWETVPIRLRWEATDSELVEGFRQWLKTERDKIGLRAIENRGKGEKDRCAKELKALGYYRLSAHYGGGQRKIPDTLTASRDSKFYELRNLAKRILTEQFKAESHPF